MIHPMLAVQGSFVPHGSTGFFFLWALDRSTTMPESWRSGGAHPLVVKGSRLQPLLRGVPYVNSLSCMVHLPGAKGLQPARVPGVALGVGAAAQWLLDLDAAFTVGEFYPDRSLRAWSTVAKLLVELLGRGRFVPVLRSEAGVLAAGWALATPEAEDGQRLAQVEAAMPDLCRAIVPPDRDVKAYRPPAAGALVSGFLQAGAAALTRLYLSDRPLPDVASKPSAVSFWLGALTGRRPGDMPAGVPDAAGLYGAVGQWSAMVTGTQGHAALCTGLRLVPPDETANGNWELELILQTADEPPISVPAEAVWAAMGQVLPVGESRFEHAEQRLLADLPAMIRLFPSLEPISLQAAPTRIELDEAGVMALLEEGAAALEQAGFPVLLPASLVRSAALQRRIHLRPVAQESQFGLSQLVAVDWELALGGERISSDELRSMARQKRLLIAHHGRWIRVDKQALAAALRHVEQFGEQVELGAALHLAPEVEETTAEGWVAELLGRLNEPARIEPVALPRGFHGALRPYQQRGLDWLAFLRRYGMGACLADDMGLGKTVQLIALLLHEREQGLTDKPTLLVCPVSLVGNWRRELERFAPSLRVLVHHGTGRADEEAFARRALDHDVVITTYTLVARDEAALAQVPWAGVVADEAQNLKNPATKHAQALRRVGAGYRVAMTGTPVENHLGDLWSLFQFLNPGLLGSMEEFRRLYAIPIERYHAEEAVARLRQQVGPLILRRLKTDPTIIDDLPEKLEYTVVTNLTVEQAAVYEAVVQETLERAADAQGIQRHGAVLAGLTRLKQVCNHPAAVLDDNGPLAGRSGKLDRLVEMLQEALAEGDQALVFTQFARFGSRLQQYLARLLACEVLFMDGSTPQVERDRRVVRFQEGQAPIFVLSLKVGGVGLNLTAASHVFHFDRWWNPAVEDQATDRAYRIGQERRVLVHKLVTAGTLEERIDRLLTEKRHLSAEVVDAGEGWLGNLSNEELRSLITLGKE